MCLYFFRSQRRRGGAVLAGCLLFLLMAGFRAAPAYPRKVLCEFFTNTYCPLCGQWIPPVDRTLEELDADSYIYLSWHTWWPGIHDPWYYDNFDQHLPGIDDIITRVAHYGYDQFMGVPSFFFDGTRIRYGNPLNGFLSQVRDLVNRRLETDSPIELSVQTAVAGDDLAAFIQVNSDQDLSGLDLFVALCEVYVQYQAQSGQTAFRGNVLHMIPNADGVHFNIPAHNLRRFDFQSSLDVGWRENPLENLELVVWVQDRNLEVLQAECVRLDHQTPQALIIDATADDWAGGVINDLFDSENLPPAVCYNRDQNGPFDREDLGNYRVILYHSYTNEEAELTEDEEFTLIQYLNEGGALILSSPALSRSMSDSPLFQRYLGVGLAENATEARSIYGAVGDPVWNGSCLLLQDEQGNPG
ncbi:MAG: hypothetical protein V2A61_07060, partial [Calditrichota bacterium]